MKENKLLNNPITRLIRVNRLEVKCKWNAEMIINDLEKDQFPRSRVEQEIFYLVHTYGTERGRGKGKKKKILRESSSNQEDVIYRFLFLLSVCQ